MSSKNGAADHREQNIAAFAGAGIPAESGIPAFRDPGWLWDQFDPDEVGASCGLIQTALAKPDYIRKFLLQLGEVFTTTAFPDGAISFFKRK